MERFIKGGCYVVVKASEWKAFAAMCDAAGITWGGSGRKVSEYEPAPLEQGRPIRVFVFCGGIRWAPADAPKSKDIPIVGFRNLKPLTEVVDKAVIKSTGHTVTARLIAGRRETKITEATCSPEDTFRFGPGAVLALFRALETEEDRILAMDLIGKERIRQLESEIPNIRDLIWGKKSIADLDGTAGMIAKALSDALGAKVEVVAGTPKRSRSLVMRMIKDALNGDVLLCDVAPKMGAAKQ